MRPNNKVEHYIKNVKDIKEDKGLKLGCRIENPISLGIIK